MIGQSMHAPDMKGHEAMQDRRLCVLNAGSSSLKFAVYDVTGTAPVRGVSGEVENIGGDGRLLVATTEGKPVHDRTVRTKDHADALAKLAALPDGPFDKRSLIGFGHRVVHGGPDMDAPVLVDDAALARIVALEPLAPLHNPPAVAVLKALADLFPKLPHVACFDTAFHRGHPAVADRFAIPDALYREGVRRYGFHGLSYEYISGALAERVPEIALGRVVIAHLGSGASMCALAGGRSVNSSMGFTALDGLPMGTRPGSLDPGIILWLQQQKGWSVKQVEHLLYADCGLKGLSGVSNDMRTCWRATRRWPGLRLNILSTMPPALSRRWRPAWGASMAWCSPPESANAAPTFAPVCCIGCTGSASPSTRRPTGLATRC